ncbi:MAG TPA: hypothetical protein PLV36_19495, partial [Zoogloea sp.]|nr:hypothetical protein [Zoogloea sp.]
MAISMIPSPSTSGASRNLPSQGSGRGDARNFWRFEWLLAVAVLISNLAVFELAWISIKEGRQRAEELAGLSTRDAAQVLDQSLTSVGRTIDVTLRALADELERSELEGR